MGAALGSAKGQNVDLYMDEEPTFPPNAGFKFQRKPREMIAKEADLISLKIPPEYRGYCAHLLIEYDQCRYKHWPLVYKCHHEKHNYDNCEHKDYVLRMKEFERERRLRMREERIAAAVVQ